MKSALEFRTRLAFGGEILAHQATFLPVGPFDRGHFSRFSYSDMQYFTGFRPVFNMNRDKLTVAQSLLTEVLR
jgi:hypothetical protein